MQTISEIIKLMLAPGLLISACGTLILTTNGKYATVSARIRLLNEERRRLLLKRKEANISDIEEQHITELTRQLENIALGIKHIRNSVVSFSSAIGLFVLASMLIGLTHLYNSTGLDTITLVIFLAGVLVAFGGTLASVYEVFKAKHT
jgi:hypothetical protein